MDGIHDLGGMHGFGPVEPDPAERGFHAPWEPHVVACVYAGIGWPLYTIDEFRHAASGSRPVHYLQASYFEQWLDSPDQLLVEKGVVSREELEARAGFSSASGARGRARQSRRGNRPPRVASRSSFRRPIAGRRRFAAGDGSSPGTSIPRPHAAPGYARSKRGVVAARTGPGSSPTRTPTVTASSPQHLYSVRFDDGSSGEPRPSRERPSTWISRTAISIRPERAGRGPVGKNHANVDPYVVSRVRALESLLLERGVLAPDAVDLVVRRYGGRPGPSSALAPPPGRGWIPSTGACSSTTRRPPWPRSISISTGSSSSRTRRRSTTWSCARSAPATRGPCSASRPPGTSSPPIARAPSPSPARCSGSSALEVPSDREIRVWDSSAEVRYMVLPRRPAGSERLGEADLVPLIPRDALIGVAEPRLAGPSLLSRAAVTERRRNLVHRADGRLVNVARFRGQLFVCATGCCCGRTGDGFAAVPAEMYHGEWERRRLRNLVHLTHRGLPRPLRPGQRGAPDLRRPRPLVPLGRFRRAGPGPVRLRRGHARRRRGSCRPPRRARRPSSSPPPAWQPRPDGQPVDDAPSGARRRGERATSLPRRVRGGRRATGIERVVAAMRGPARSRGRTASWSSRRRGRPASSGWPSRSRAGRLRLGGVPPGADPLRRRGRGRRRSLRLLRGLAPAFERCLPGRASWLRADLDERTYQFEFGERDDVF